MSINIAVFGGSFDPIHIGHEQIVSSVLNTLDIDKLFVVPTYLNPFKSTSYLDAQTRFSLVSDVFKNEEKVIVSDFEVRQEKKVPTYKTIQYLKSQYDLNTIYLVIGADNLKNIHLWYNAKQLRDSVKFIVISRDKIEEKNDFIKAIYINLDVYISSTKLRNNMELKYIPTNIQQKVKKLWKIE